MLEDVDAIMTVFGVTAAVLILVVALWFANRAARGNRWVRRQEESRKND